MHMLCSGIYQWARQQTTAPYELSHLTELALIEPIRTLDWCDTALLLGTRKEYTIMSVQSQATLEICQVGKKATTVACLLPDRELILVQDYLGICFTYDGKPSRQDPIAWSDVPIAISYHHPYLIAILANDTIECRNQQTGGILQKHGHATTGGQHRHNRGMDNCVELTDTTSSNISMVR